MPENASDSRSGGLSAVFTVFLVLVILFPLGFSAVRYIVVPSPPAAESFLEMPEPQYKECVRDIEYMRLHHWELLRHVREEVVRYGKRGEVSLAKCRDCHTSRERFCNRCHDAASVLPDCFECHYYP